MQIPEKAAFFCVVRLATAKLLPVSVKRRYGQIESKWLRCNLADNVINRKVTHSRADFKVF